MRCVSIRYPEGGEVDGAGMSCVQDDFWRAVSSGESTAEIRYCRFLRSVLEGQPDSVSDFCDRRNALACKGLPALPAFPKLRVVCGSER